MWTINTASLLIILIFHFSDHEIHIVSIPKDVTEFYANKNPVIFYMTWKHYETFHP